MTQEIETLMNEAFEELKQVKAISGVTKEQAPKYYQVILKYIEEEITPKEWVEFCESIKMS